MKLTALLAVAFAAAAAGCAGASGPGQNETSADDRATETPAAVATSNPNAAAQVLREFFDAVLSADLESAWRLYAASVPGSAREHDPQYGCDFNAFGFELPKMRHFLMRVSPYEILDTYSNAPLSPVIEFRIRGADGNDYLATLLRARPLEEYRVRFLNSGRTTQIPGVPDPLPSPEDPLGACGIWPGAR
jgi:hypothetical protein